MVNPDLGVPSLHVKSVTSPYDAGVDVGELDALDDDVAGVFGDGDTLALDHTAAALADEGLLGPNSDTKHASIVVLDAGRRGIGLVVLAP